MRFPELLQMVNEVRHQVQTLQHEQETIRRKIDAIHLELQHVRSLPPGVSRETLTNGEPRAAHDLSTWLEEQGF